MNMKKSLIALGALALSASGMAQNAYDALSLNQMDPIMGTARYSSMAGAFGALGGNPSVTKDNPAGLGVYKCFDISFTPNLYLDNDKDVSLCLNNFAVVVNFRNTGKSHGYVTSSLGISYNRLRNYSRYTSIRSNNYSGSSASDFFGLKGAPDAIYDRAYESGLVDSEGQSTFSKSDNFDKTVRFSESGHASQWDIAYGMNISNRVYIGASMGIVSLSYSQKALYDETSLATTGDNFYLDNYYRAEAGGINFKLGTIVKATDFLRVGLSIQTPTFYDVDEESSIEMDYNEQSPLDAEIAYSEYSYRMNAPFKFEGSLGFVIGRRALIGIQYDMENYKSMRLMDRDFRRLEDENEFLKNSFNVVHSIRLGGEVKIIDQLALRAGFAYLTSPIDYSKNFGNDCYLYRPLSLPNQTFYVTGGIGYEGEHFYCDLAYVFRNQKSHFYDMLPKDSSMDVWNLNLKNRNISATFGWRF